MQVVVGRRRISNAEGSFNATQQVTPTANNSQAMIMNNMNIRRGIKRYEDNSVPQNSFDNTSEETKQTP